MSPAWLTMYRLVPESLASAARRRWVYRPDPEREGGTVVLAAHASRPAVGQPQVLGQIGQRLAPERDLFADQAVRLVLAAEELPLPQRVVRVLDGQFRPPRPTAVEPGGVRIREVTRQRPHRPSVTRDVVQHQHQHVVVRRHREQVRPQRQLVGEVEGAAGGEGESLGQFGLRGPGDPGLDLGLLRRHDALVGGAVDVRVGGAERFVPVRQVLDRRGECGTVEAALQAHGDRHVVGGARAFQPVQEPQPLLRVRERGPLRRRARTTGRRRVPATRSSTWRAPATVGAAKRSRMDRSTPERPAPGR